MFVEKIDKPHLVTKPIQLLAAWLVGLTVIDASFLGAAKLIGSNTWECGVLVCAAVANVPIFILALFLLQTKFRPEMQEDSFYSEYINRKTGSSVQISKIDFIERQIEEFKQNTQERRLQIESKRITTETEVSINDYLPFYKEIREKLRESNINVSSIFVKLSGINVKPEKNLVAIADDLTAGQILPILKVCCEFPFEGLYRMERIPDVDEEDVYLGPYGRTRTITPFTPELIDEIRNAHEGKQIGFLLKDSEDF